MIFEVYASEDGERITIASPEYIHLLKAAGDSSIKSLQYAILAPSLEHANDIYDRMTGSLGWFYRVLYKLSGVLQ